MGRSGSFTKTTSGGSTTREAPGQYKPPVRWVHCIRQGGQSVPMGYVELNRNLSLYVSFW